LQFLSDFVPDITKDKEKHPVGSRSIKERVNDIDQELKAIKDSEKQE